MNTKTMSSAKETKHPQRMCIACREMFDKRKMVRIVKNKENEIDVDNSGKKPGRGAYICYNSECLARAKKSKCLERVFKSRIDEQVWVKLHDLLISVDS